jgi:hypothetical protein
VQDGVDVVKDIPLGDGVLYRGVGRLEGQRHFWWVSLPREWPRLGWRGWCFTMGVRNSASLGLPWGGTTKVVPFPILLRFRVWPRAIRKPSRGGGRVGRSFLIAARRGRRCPPGSLWGPSADRTPRSHPR